MSSAGPPVVIGVGEEFRHDDAVGPAVIAELRRLTGTGRLPQDTRLEVCFGEPTGLIELWHGARLAIVVDAAAADPAAGLAPGQVVRWEVRDRDREQSRNRGRDPDEGHEPGHHRRPAASSGSPDPVLPGPGPAATHGLGPGAAIELAGILRRMPGRLLLFAVAGADFTLGSGLSAPVADAVRRVAEDIAEEVRREGLSARAGGDLQSCSGDGARSKLDA